MGACWSSAQADRVIERRKDVRAYLDLPRSVGNLVAVRREVECHQLTIPTITSIHQEQTNTYHQPHLSGTSNRLLVKQHFVRQSLTFQRT